MGYIFERLARWLWRAMGYASPGNLLQPQAQFGRRLRVMFLIVGLVMLVILGLVVLVRWWWLGLGLVVVGVIWRWGRS